MRVLLFIAAVALAAPDRPDPSPKPARRPKDQIQGAWQVVESTWNGGQPYGSVQPGAIFIFKGERLSFHHKAGAAELKYLTPFDDAKNPATIGFASDAGMEKPNHFMPGIFKFEDDTLIICYNPGGARPTEFATTKDSGRVLWKMKRMTP